MPGKNETSSATVEKEDATDFVISRVFDAPREVVFRAWSEPQELAKWWGPRGMSTPVCELDFKPGGKYRMVMRDKQGVEYPITGEFREISRPSLILMTQDVSKHPGEWLDRVKPERLKTKDNPEGVLFTRVIFTEEGKQTRITIRTKFSSAAVSQSLQNMGMMNGWGSSLDRLAEQVGAPGREIVISRLVDAPREMVWDAMTKPENVVKWWGPRGFSTTISQMDVRPGGTWSHVMRGPDGAEYPNKSVFQEVVKPERIVYAHSGARKDQKGAHFLSTWTFDPAPGGKTVVTIRQVYDTPEDREMIIRMYGAIEGGHQTLGRLNEEMSKIPVVVERTLAAPMDKVWSVLTNLAEMKQWYFPQLTAFEPRVGFETQFTITMHEVDYPHLWRVTEVQPGKRITYSWKYGGYSGESFVTFELSPAATGTHLTLTHRDLETFEPDKNPMMVRSNFVMGWNHFGDSLMSYSQKQSGGVEDFVISRVFDAPRQRVWDAWTKESELARWFGPKGCTISQSKMDMRPGGTYLYCMKTGDGKEMWGKWVFRQIDPPRKLELVNSFSDANGGFTRHPFSPTWPMEMLSTTTFEEVDGKTKVTIVWGPVNATEEERKTFDNARPSMNMGWGGTFEQLADYLAKG